MLASRTRLLGSFLLLAGVFFWFGCPTPPKPTPRVTALAPAAPHPSVRQPVETVSVPVEPQLRPPQERSGSVLPEERLNWPAGILPLNAWAQLCGFSEVRVLSAAVPRTIELRTADHAVVLTAGQRNARWNGYQFGLGFAPVLAGGELSLNSLDVQKNLYPLAIGVFPSLGKSRVLVIDPGHGGADPGSRGSQRTAVEKDLTLDWALRVERLLAGTAWRVVLTRRQDQEVALLDRVALADAVRADLFISLHFNSLEASGPGREESGIETFCSTPAGMPSTIKRNFEDDWGTVYPNNQFDAENLLLAMRLHSGLIKATARRDRGVKRARFMTVLREQKRPAVLIEGGFLSNPAEAAQILRPEFRQQMAQAICSALPD